MSGLGFRVKGLWFRVQAGHMLLAASSDANQLNSINEGIIRVSMTWKAISASNSGVTS